MSHYEIDGNSKGEVGVSKFIPTHLICPFSDEPFFA
jgi:hypothetical protein